MSEEENLKLMYTIFFKMYNSYEREMETRGARLHEDQDISLLMGGFWYEPENRNIMDATANKIREHDKNWVFIPPSQILIVERTWYVDH